MVGRGVLRNQDNPLRRPSSAPQDSVALAAASGEPCEALRRPVATLRTTQRIKQSLSGASTQQHCPAGPPHCFAISMSPTSKRSSAGNRYDQFPFAAAALEE